MGIAKRIEVGAAAAAVVAALLACKGGANQNQKGVGDQPGGVALGLGDIAVAPVGDYVLFKRGDELATGNLTTGAIDTLPVQKPSRLAFSKQRPFVYVGTEATSEILAVDMEARKVGWRQGVPSAYTSVLRLMSSKDDRFVVSAQGQEVQVFDATSGAPKGSFAFEGALIDVQVFPDSKRALAVELHEWSGDAPSTRVTVLDLETSARRTLTVPNCADRVAISADSKRALLAPTTCQKDPVSVIDLSEGAKKFERNLPGFGPVALSPDGTTAVAFLDRDSIDLTLFDDPKLAPTNAAERYHLMLIDTGNLSYEFVAAGDELPRFAITPDGNVLLVDTAWTDDAARLLDVPSRTFKPIAGPKVRLDNFVLTKDSSHAFVLQGSVYDLDIGSAISSMVGTSFTPKNINISADDKALFLRVDDDEICMFDLATRSCARSFVAVQ